VVIPPTRLIAGLVVDVLVGNEGKIDAFIVSIGGFLGMDSKDVGIPFNAVRQAASRSKA
jgi:PRC-barrel domain